LNPQASTNIKLLIKSVLSENNFNILNKSRKKFIENIMISFLSIKGRINFLQLERFGKYSESTYRNEFEEKFNFFEFNKSLAIKSLSNIIIGFDPSYISKSGKKTYGLGNYSSGVAAKLNEV
jgi:hypothetical protein